MKIPELQLQVAAFGNFQGVSHRLWTVRKRGGNVVRRFDIQLVRTKTPALFVRPNLPTLHTQQYFVSFSILGLEVVAIISSDKRERKILGQFDQRRVDPFLFRQMVVLYLNVEAVIKDRGVFGGDLTRELIAASQHCSSQLTTQTTRQGDDPCVQFTQEFLIHARLVVEPFSVSRRDQAAQITVPF